MKQSPVLQVDGLGVRYGAIQALDGVSFEVRSGEIFAVLGANGAGKTTLIRAISGLAPVSSGSIRSGTEVLSSMKPYRIARAGFSVVPEGGGTFPAMTVDDNLRVGPTAAGIVADERDRRVAAVYDRFLKLKERHDQKAGTLSGGERQMLGIARTLMVDSRVVLLDEPSLGLAPLIVKQIFELLADLAAEGYTILLVEQNARRALELASDALVLERGVVRRSGTAASLLADGDIADLYLGGGTSAPEGTLT